MEKCLPVGWLLRYLSKVYCDRDWGIGLYVTFQVRLRPEEECEEEHKTITTMNKWTMSDVGIQ